MGPAQAPLRLSSGLLRLCSGAAQPRLRVKQRPLRVEALTGAGEKKILCPTIKVFKPVKIIQAIFTWLVDLDSMSLFSDAAFKLLSVGGIGVLNVLGAVPLAAYRAFGHESSPSMNTTIECNIPKAEVVRVMLLIAFKDGNRLTHFVLFKTDSTFFFIFLIERS
jgi:hypothetical protein